MAQYQRFAFHPDPEEIVRAHLLLEEWKIRRELAAGAVSTPVAARPAAKREGFNRQQAAKLIGCSKTHFDRYRKTHPELLEPAFMVGAHPRWTRSQLDKLLTLIKREGNGHRH